MNLDILALSSEDHHNHDGWAEAGDEMSGRGNNTTHPGTEIKFFKEVTYEFECDYSITAWVRVCLYRLFSCASWHATGNIS